MQNLENFRSQFIAGNNSALRDLYIEYFEDVTSVILSKNICDQEEVESYYNDSVLDLYERILAGKLTEVNSLKNYLIGTCYNLAKREYSKKTQLENKVEEIRLQFYYRNNHIVDDSYKDELIQLIKKEISELSDKCQQIIKAYYLDALTMKEIAQYLNLSSADVAKTLKSRCFKKLMNNVKSGIK